MCQDVSASLSVFGRRNTMFSKDNIGLTPCGSAWPQQLTAHASESVGKFRVKSSHNAMRASRKHAATAFGSVESRPNLMLNEESVFLNLNEQLDVNIDEDEVCVEDNSIINNSRFLNVRESADFTSGAGRNKKDNSKSKGSFMQTAASTQFH